ncbi:hypothetical protein E2C01_079211 [Portunus trituberculatus]|uniref:Uncharacterized protein n=1 Tax=Portunus trituberculatus TaxID=210409 RepID=A0A5B7IKX1_PORTR|nr:hypothetical protein [Portunus trituberculatus]
MFFLTFRFRNKIVVRQENFRFVHSKTEVRLSPPSHSVTTGTHLASFGVTVSSRMLALQVAKKKMDITKRFLFFSSLPGKCEV